MIGKLNKWILNAGEFGGGQEVQEFLIIICDNPRARELPVVLLVAAPIDSFRLAAYPTGGPWCRL